MDKIICVISGGKLRLNEVAMILQTLRASQHANVREGDTVAGVRSLSSPQLNVEWGEDKERKWRRRAPTAQVAGAGVVGRCTFYPAATTIALGTDDRRCVGRCMHIHPSDYDGYMRSWWMPLTT
jgi:hypothetical protein